MSASSWDEAKRCRAGLFEACCERALRTTLLFTLAEQNYVYPVMNTPAMRILNVQVTVCLLARGGALQLLLCSAVSCYALQLDVMPRS